MHVDKLKVGKKIKSIRLDLGESMEQFGKRIDNAKSGVVSNWENGKQLPNKKRLKMICDLTGVKVSEFLNDSGDTDG